MRLMLFAFVCAAFVAGCHVRTQSEARFEESLDGAPAEVASAIRSIRPGMTLEEVEAALGVRGRAGGGSANWTHYSFIGYPSGARTPLDGLFTIEVKDGAVVSKFERWVRDPYTGVQIEEH